MSNTKFLHISDTHYRLDYGNELDYWGVTYDPVTILENFLANYDFVGHDFVVHTGDIVHDGDLADYSAFKELLEKYVPAQLPIFYCLGNHDRKELFYEAFYGSKDKRQPYYHEQHVNGLRLVFLDTADPTSHDGVISQEQEDWLQTILATENEKGTLIFHHHPLEISWKKGMERTQISATYMDMLQKSDVKGIFTGHLHMNRLRMIGDIPQATNNSLVFGITREGEELWNTNRLGYSVVTIEDNDIDIFNELIYPAYDKLNQNIL